jgi:hypothetical protein
VQFHYSYSIYQLFDVVEVVGLIDPTEYDY